MIKIDVRIARTYTTSPGVRIRGRKEERQKTRAETPIITAV